MQSLDYIRSLYDYNAWANGHVLDAASKLSDADLCEELGASFGSVRGNIVHVLWAQGVWLSRFRGEGMPTQLGDEATLYDINTAYAASHDALTGYVGSLTEAGLATELTYRDTRGIDFAPPLWQPLLHMVNHGTHHRAECAMLLTSLGAPPRQLDFIFFELERAGAPERLT